METTLVTLVEFEESLLRFLEAEHTCTIRYKEWILCSVNIQREREIRCPPHASISNNDIKLQEQQKKAVISDKMVTITIYRTTPSDLSMIT